MQKLDSFHIQLKQKLSRIAPSQVIGASGLAVLCAASALALAPPSEQALVTALVQWVGGLGLNVLAGVLQQSYQDLLSKPPHNAQEQLTRLAELLTEDVRRQAKLRHEVGAFLGEGNLDAFRIAQEVVEGNPAVHGWLLVQIFQDVTQYRSDFDQIHVTLAEMKRLIEQTQQPLEVSAPDAQVKFSHRLIHTDSTRGEHLYVLRVIFENTGLQVIDNLKLEFEFPDFDSVPRKWEIVGFLGEIPSEAIREASSPLVEVNPEEDTVSVRRGQYVIQVTYRSRDKIFPDEEVDLTDAIGLRFRINRSVYTNLSDMPSLSWTLYADDMPRKQGDVPISQLNDYWAWLRKIAEDETDHYPSREPTGGKGEPMTRTILILAANPKNTSRLRLDQEVREIENGLQRASRRDEFALKYILAARPVDVRRAMLDSKPNIVHFCGHGAGDEGIALEDETGNAKLVDSEVLACFFELFADKVRCVVLNACYSETQAEAIAQHIEYVVGMKKGVKDTAAIEFAVAFYDALGAGESVEFAYKLACNAIQMADLPGHSMPVLKTRSEVSRFLIPDEGQSIIDLQEVFSSSTCSAVGTGPSRIFHNPWPYILPVCFKIPAGGYIYIVVGDKTEDIRHIITKPPLAVNNIKSFQMEQTPYWYHLTSDKPLESIRFKNYSEVTDFKIILAEFYPQGTWNVSNVMTIPGDRPRAYALAVTEQMGSSIWLASADDEDFTFDQEQGCHFFEFVLQTGKEHNLSLKYKEGPWGIACAFFAF